MEHIVTIAFDFDDKTVLKRLLRFWMGKTMSTIGMPLPAPPKGD